MDEKKISLAREMRKQGKTWKSIALQLKEFPSTIQYHLEDDYRNTRKKRVVENRRKLSKEQRYKIYLKHYPYAKAYFLNRYRTDKDFKQKHIQRVIKAEKKRKEKNGINRN
jgi:hypothetical protein